MVGHRKLPFYDIWPSLGQRLVVPEIPSLLNREGDRAFVHNKSAAASDCQFTNFSGEALRQWWASHHALDHNSILISAPGLAAGGLRLLAEGGPQKTRQFEKRTVTEPAGVL